MPIADPELADALRNLRFCECGHEPGMHEVIAGKCQGRCDACSCPRLRLREEPAKPRRRGKR